jgi:hypothetical protein
MVGITHVSLSGSIIKTESAANTWMDVFPLSWVFESKLSTVFCIQHVLDMNVVLYYEGCSRIQKEPGEQLMNAI